MPVSFFFTFCSHPVPVPVLANVHRVLEQPSSWFWSWRLPKAQSFSLRPLQVVKHRFPTRRASTPSHLLVRQTSPKIHPRIQAIIRHLAILSTLPQSLYHCDYHKSPRKSGAVDGQTLALILASRTNTHPTRLPTIFELLSSVVGTPFGLLLFSRSNDVISVTIRC